ncbi:NAD(P)-dependent oxidoreductase [Chitinilyticum piscinae]|uniref:NAD(P)-dependent oxidoreductase n=1 Tax=Chitinilyticum piscinae TaxID=2866724 RepID=A0A8J7K2Q5_9NEIS|nr:NAD(P)-dependent oxidoreductase [Chitinilyticum piscinae]MBE9610811.1 NAD(P)-dependent oxidoreductase [Chitinilyticum piscinae]
MKIALIGATGFIGSALLTEALQRGHHLTALVRHPEKLAAQVGLTALASDVFDSTLLASQLQGHDLVLSAFSGHSDSDVAGYYARGFASIVAAVKAADVPRLLTIGGAGSLEVAPGVQVLDTPDFPDAWRASAESARAALYSLREEGALNWTMASPSAHIHPGERTGLFRLGSDQLLVAADGESHISLADFAIAVLDEAEQARYPRQRFTAGY